MALVLVRAPRPHGASAHTGYSGTVFWGKHRCYSEVLLAIWLCTRTHRCLINSVLFYSILQLPLPYSIGQCPVDATAHDAQCHVPSGVVIPSSMDGTPIHHDDPNFHGDSKLTMARHRASCSWDRNSPCSKRDRTAQAALGKPGWGLKQEHTRPSVSFCVCQFALCGFLTSSHPMVAIDTAINCV